MTQMSRISFGQPVEPCQTPDKWALLDALSTAACRYGLNHRTLGVLRALLSFLPERALPLTPLEATVYPSNRVLCARLNGMPESTLRRHLARLVSGGWIQRQDSANRKRFARSGTVAFGFDLSPLARMAEDITQAAEDETRACARVAALRARLAATRQRLLDDGSLTADNPLIEDSRLALRRKLTEDRLETLCAALETHLDNARQLPSPTAEMSASDTRNDRHIQTTDESESVMTVETSDASPSLVELMQSCQEYRDYFPDVRPDWHGLLSVSEALHRMMGIDRSVYTDALAQLGQQTTVTVILCMLERLARIRNPGAYLRGLIRKKARGELNLKAMVAAVARANRGGSPGSDALIC